MKKSLLNAINQISTTEEMNEVIDLIRLKQKQIRDMKSSKVKSSLKVGMNVKIDGKNVGLLSSYYKNGVKFGVVEKIKLKKAIVKIDGRLWDCPLTIIEAADKTKYDRVKEKCTH